MSQWKALIDLFRRGPYPWNPEQLYAPGYGPRGQGGQTTVTVTQNIRSTDPAAAGLESAAAIEKVMNQRMSAFVNMNAMGAGAH